MVYSKFFKFPQNLQAGLRLWWGLGSGEDFMWQVAQVTVPGPRGQSHGGQGQLCPVNLTHGSC